jgi:hypothetical protein
MVAWLVVITGREHAALPCTTAPAPPSRSTTLGGCPGCGNVSRPGRVNTTNASKPCRSPPLRALVASYASAHWAQRELSAANWMSTHGNIVLPTKSRWPPVTDSQ